MESTTGHPGAGQHNHADATSATARDTSTYLAAVASSSPTPGGGSVAGVVGALAAALGEMVCRLSLGRSVSPEEDEAIAAAFHRLSDARQRLLELAVEDETAYGAYRTAAALPKVTPTEKGDRRRAMQTALLAAAQVPLATARACGHLLPDIALVVEKGNPHVRSDARIAAILADATVRASGINVRVNTAMLRDPARAAELDSEISAIEKDASSLASRIT